MSENAKSIEAALKDPAPEIGNPLPTTVDLHRGLFDTVSGVWQTTAEVRELTGADEEYLASLEAKPTTTYVDYMNALLRRNVVSIGNFLIEEHPELVESLIIGDRETLFMAIVKCTYGVDREYNVTCPKCEGKNDVVVNIDEDFKVEKPEVDIQSPIPVKLRNNKTLKFRLPTGGDSAYVAKHASSIASQNTLMLARCVLLEPEDLKGVSPEEWAKNLSLADRNKLIKAILGIKVGPQLEEVNVQCAHCGHNMPLSITWMSLLFG
jgi:hypothetical protein